MTSQTPRAVAEAIGTRGRISDEDVLGAAPRHLGRRPARRPRRSGDAAGPPARGAGTCSRRADLYVEALSEFFLADDTVSDAGAELLAREVVADGVVEDASELLAAPQPGLPLAPMPAAARGAGQGRAPRQRGRDAAAFYGKGPRRPGVVDADDVEAIRRLVYAPGGADGVQVGEGEALWLAELDRATAGADNAPGRRDLFVKATAMYLLLGRGGGGHATIRRGRAGICRTWTAAGGSRRTAAPWSSTFAARPGLLADPGLTALAA